MPSRVRQIFGPSLTAAVQGRTVVDFGCGTGHDAVELARIGAKRVIGVDIRPSVLEIAERRARAAGLGDICEFATILGEQVDVVVSIDAFEHFAAPGAILDQMAARLAPGGGAWISFGPPWLHPLGGHLFSVFPWAHLIFTEGALIRWRSDFKTDGARRFSEVEGGLNQMTIKRFERLVTASPLEFVCFEAVPIRTARLIHNWVTREFFTSIIRCRLKRKDDREVDIEE